MNTGDQSSGSIIAGDFLTSFQERLHHGDFPYLNEAKNCVKLFTSAVETLHVHCIEHLVMYEERVYSLPTLKEMGEKQIEVTP